MLEGSTAGGGSKPTGMAVQVTLPEELMHAWCRSILKPSRLEPVGSKIIFVAVTQLALITQVQRMKSTVWSATNVMQFLLSSCSWSKAVAAAFTTVIRWKGLLEFAAITASASHGVGRKEADPGQVTRPFLFGALIFPFQLLSYICKEHQLLGWREGSLSYCTFDFNLLPGPWKLRIMWSYQWDYCRAG